jgi:hypothetical protein
MNENEDLIGSDGNNPAGMQITFTVASARRFVSIDVDVIIKYHGTIALNRLSSTMKANEQSGMPSLIRKNTFLC